jgi:uncharacterized membrane protein YfcA
MDIEIYLVIFFVALLQSVFGVGVLLVGTPILMLLGLPYFEVLSLTLPTSFFISIIQVGRFYKYINRDLLKKALLFTIPIIPVGMVLASYLGNAVGILMGFFLILTTYNFVAEFILPADSSNKRVSMTLIFMGIIHGATNLGGGILPSVVNQKCEFKQQKLATTAAIYLAFQVTQIIFIVFRHYPVDVSRSTLCVMVGLSAYILFGKYLFKLILVEQYKSHLRIFIRMVALLLVSVKLYNFII